MLFGIGLLFWNGRSTIGWLLTIGGGCFILAGADTLQHAHLLPGNQPVQHLGDADPPGGGTGNDRPVDEVASQQLMWREAFRSPRRRIGPLLRPSQGLQRSVASISTRLTPWATLLRPGSRRRMALAIVQRTAPPATEERVTIQVDSGSASGGRLFPETNHLHQ